MTPEQYQEYTEKSEEINEVKRFLECGIGCTYNRFTQRFPFNLIVQEWEEHREKKLFLYRQWHCSGKKENTFELPTSLQKELVKTMERWLTEKERELLEI